MARRSLDAVKKELSQAFLGRGGIHAVGINRSQKAIRLYVHGAGKERDRVIEEARRAATPFSVVVVEEQPPTALA